MIRSRPFIARVCSRLDAGHPCWKSFRSVAGQVPKLSTRDCAVDAACAHRAFDESFVVHVYDAHLIRPPVN